MRHERPLLVKDGLGREMAGQFGLRFRLPRKSQGSFNMPQSCDMGPDGFTSPPKEAMLWIFSPEKSDGFGRVRDNPTTKRGAETYHPVCGFRLPA
jgi:hypothetical protein